VVVRSYRATENGNILTDDGTFYRRTPDPCRLFIGVGVGDATNGFRSIVDSVPHFQMTRTIDTNESQPVKSTP
jgi:hypothetical protein